MATVNKKQKNFLNDILEKRLPVERAMELSDIRGEVLCRWFSTPAFIGELARRIEIITKRADMVISQNRLTAAEKLVKLTSCDKEETARKACLDILELTAANKTQLSEDNGQAISGETAAKLLEILANEKQT
jgi:hypothetical protein